MRWPAEWAMTPADVWTIGGQSERATGPAAPDRPDAHRTTVHMPTTQRPDHHPGILTR